MPELPEVETVKRGLSNLLPGHKITDVKHDWDKSFPNAKTDVQAFLIGAKVTNVKRRAKVLLIELDTNYSLVIHLKMTGQLVYVKDDSTARFGAGHPTSSLTAKLPDRSTRVILYLSKPGIASAQEPDARNKQGAEQTVQVVQSVSTEVSDKAGGLERWRSFGLSPKAGQSDAKLFFNDQRKFGWMRLIPTTEVENIDFFKKLGPEPLSDDFKAKDFIKCIRKRNRTNVKAALLDQTVIAGVGNIYADESLWGAKIHPASKVLDISDSKLKKLFEELQFVLRLSIEKGGSTDKNYVDAEGKKGSYLSFAKVFRQENKPCPRCGTVIEKTRVAGRGTHFCPNCQHNPTPH